MRNIRIPNTNVYDKTFPTRFVSFLKDIEVNDLMGYEELHYLQKVANELLEYQLDNVNDTQELDYLKRIYPNKDIILKI